MKCSELKGAVSQNSRNSNSGYCHQIVWNIKITAQKNTKYKIQNRKEVTDGQTSPAASESLLA